MQDLSSTLRKIIEFSHDSLSLRDDESRKVLDVLSEDGMLVKLDDKPLKIINKIDKLRNRYSGIIGLDSSSRVVDTPYFFIGIGAVSAMDRINGYTIDCPSIYSITNISGNQLDEVNYECKWLSIVPEIDFSNGNQSILERLNYINTRSPSGRIYDHHYNKYAVLNELRLSLENFMISKVVNHMKQEDLLVLDGPLYHTPSLFNLYLSRSKPAELKPYIESWVKLLSDRIRVVKQLSSRGNRIVGVVKRLEYSRLLSNTINDIGLGLKNNSRLNDYAFLTILSYELVKEKGYSIVFILGPFKFSPKYSGVDKFVSHAFDKVIYYIGVPRTRHYVLTHNNYVFYRIELSRDDNDILETILYDSIGSGVLLPLSILLVDKRVKGLSRSLYIIINRMLEEIGIPLTYDSMRSIEGYYSGF